VLEEPFDLRRERLSGLQLRPLHDLPRSLDGLGVVARLQRDDASPTVHLPSELADFAAQIDTFDFAVAFLFEHGAMLGKAGRSTAPRERAHKVASAFDRAVRREKPL
jgi:hypothetical protein